MAFRRVVKPASCLQCFGFLSAGEKKRDNVDASSKNVETRESCKNAQTPYDTEQLRAQAKKTLQDAFASGRLKETLAEIRPKAAPTREISEVLSTYTAYTRQKNERRDMTAKCKGIARKMEKTKGVMSKEAMARQLQEVNELMSEFLVAIHPTKATMQIREEEVLLEEISHDLKAIETTSRAFTNTAVTPHYEISTPPSDDEIKSRVPIYSMSALELREKATRALLAGLSSGRLELALAETRAPDNVASDTSLPDACAKEPRSEPETEELRAMIKQSFLDGMTSGRANSAPDTLNEECGEQDSENFQESQQADTETDEILRQFKLTLTNGLESGRLQSVLTKLTNNRCVVAPDPSKGGS